ncbi:hypothetical protein [Demequina sediminicola]|uniref:hypothetical protein n=1 Tax=Demequina sediminicola TaxID=1095026 RepID=UPI000A5836BA|nr:hypothetical protein [Demequina sediminicola]
MENDTAPPARGGAWSVYRPGWLALYSIGLAFLVFFNWGVWETGSWILPGLVTLFFLTMASRQFYLFVTR